MLKRLRIKFVVVNMIIVILMMGIIFSLLYYSTEMNLERESMQMLGTAALNPLQALPNVSRDSSADISQPYFSILIDSSGAVVSASGQYFDLSDPELLTELLDTVSRSDRQSGVLKEYQLRYFRVDTPMGTSIVFADMTGEQAALRSLVRSFALIGLPAFFAFLAVSILLSFWAVRPVAEAWRQQKQFIADASHELKTPLTVILTDAELLQAADCPESDRAQLSGSIITMSDQMRGLVESLLELARIDAGTVKETMGVISLTDILQEAAMLFEPIFFEKEMPFEYSIEPGIMITGNSRHLKQAADILLDNAAKYASPGGKTTLTLKRVSARKCRLTVSNQGEPIADADLKNLFRRFYRADKARSGHHSYGLGLAIAESIAAEHGGKIRVESRGGYNSFYLEFPCR